MKLKITILTVVIAVVVISSVVVAAIAVFQPEFIRGTFSKPYSVVYLSTGEIYIGKLSSFPRLTLSDTYLLQIVPNVDDPSQSGYQLVPLSNTLWSPQKIYLNEDQVIFTAPVRDDSQVAQTLNSQGGISTQSQLQQPSGVAPQEPSATPQAQPSTEQPPTEPPTESE